MITAYGGSKPPPYGCADVSRPFRQTCIIVCNMLQSFSRDVVAANNKNERVHTMKRIIAFILAALFVLALFAACEKSKDKDDDEDSVEGKYVVYSVDGVKIDKDEQDYYKTIELKKSGKYVIAFSSGSTSEGEWKKKGSKIILDDDENPEITYKNGKLYIESYGTELVYKKK